MLSFAAEVKNELSRSIGKNRGEDDRACCRCAELSALLRAGATLEIDQNKEMGLTFSTENAAVARLAIIRLKEMGIAATEVAVSRSQRLKKNNRYEVRALPQAAINSLVLSLELSPQMMPAAGKGILKRSCCEVSYLRGVFLASGSVNRPGAEYHLEFIAASRPFAALIHQLTKKLNFPTSLTDRKETFIVYLKEADAIADFLGLIGAERAAEKFEVTRNVREVRNQVNRLVNCETANLQRAVNAASQQTAAIRALLNKNIALSEPLYMTAKLRLEEPDATLAELAAKLHVTKSGMNHRLRKLRELAKSIETTD